MLFLASFLLVVRSLNFLVLCHTQSLLGTSIFQPADVGLNRVIKHCLKQDQTEYLMESQQQQINSGLTAEQVKYMTSLPVLCDASVAGIVSVYNFMTIPFGRELISYVFYSQSWECCEIKNWNLSTACLTSKATQAALNDYLQTHLTLHDKIKG